MQDFSQEERGAIKELVLHPKFGAFLDDWKDYDSLVKTTYEKMIEIAFPNNNLSTEQVQRMREQYNKNRPQKKKKKEKANIL
ncbi:MAG: hypothetical protein R6U44_00580 [Archaeoglobaceae archaeon]